MSTTIEVNDHYKAPPGKFRVMGYDDFSHEDYYIQDYNTKEEAIRRANDQSMRSMQRGYVHDDTGKIVYPEKR